MHGVVEFVPKAMRVELVSKLVAVLHVLATSVKSASYQIGALFDIPRSSIGLQGKQVVCEATVS